MKRKQILEKRLARLQAKKALPLIDKGIVTMKDLVDSGEKYTDNQRFGVFLRKW